MAFDNAAEATDTTDLWDAIRPETILNGRTGRGVRVARGRPARTRGEFRPARSIGGRLTRPKSRRPRRIAMIAPLRARYSAV